MDGVVAIDPTAFRSAYPEFAGLSDSQVTTFFVIASQFCDNTPSSPITDWSIGGLRETCLYELTAHVASLRGFGTQGAARAGLVGRIASAGQGSVNVSVEMPSNPNNAWFMQTQYGATFWAMTAQFRTFFYVRAATRRLDPFVPGPFPT